MNIPTWATRPVVALLLCAASTLAQATTWDEPWYGEVVRGSETLGLYEIESVGDTEVRAKTLRILAGTPTEGTITIDAHAYWHLDLGSYSKHEGHDELPPAFDAGGHVYLLLKRKGTHWQLPTPTAGIAGGVMDGGNVASTYRISIERTSQATDAFERDQACLFRRLHEQGCDTKALAADLVAPLHEPAGALSEKPSEEEAHRFFRQHVALEMAYLLDTSVPLTTLEPFLQRQFFQVQVSAVRALRASDDPGRNDRLVAFIADDTREPNARVMAVMMAKEIADATLTRRIKAINIGKDVEAGLPMNIMDPRIGTRFPSGLKEAIEGL